jgi:hypothetical protein
MFPNLDLFPPSGERRETPTLLGSLERLVQLLRLPPSNVPNRVGVSLPSPVNENRTSFQNATFSSSSEFQMIGKILEPSDSVLYTYVLTLQRTI